MLATMVAVIIGRDQEGDGIVFVISKKYTMDETNLHKLYIFCREFKEN